ncbi:MAG: hypothetical protein K2Z81_01620 [Cyanobacteria bacterium]|nr:hypothetical protein [Cyanobacteriota bacterium]
MVLPSSQIATQSLGRGVEQRQIRQIPVSEMCIICDGAEGLALSNLVAADSVLLYRDGVVGKYPNLDELQAREFEVRERGAAVCSSRGNTRGDLRNGDDVEEIRKAEGILISLKTTKYGALIDRLGKAFRDGQTICLINAPLGASLQFRHLLNQADCDRKVNILETGKLFDLAKVESNTLLISGMRERVSVCGVERNETRRGLNIAQAIVDELVPSSNVIERGLADVERIVRPVLLLTALMSGKAHQISEIPSLLSPAVLRLLVAVEREVQMLAKCFQCVVPTFVRSLDEFAGVGKRLPRPESIDEALRSLGPALFSQLSDQTNSHAEMLAEDVCETLTLLMDLGTLSRSPVGVISSVVEMASVVVGSNLLDKGRNVSSLGLVGFDCAEIGDLVNS